MEPFLSERILLMVRVDGNDFQASMLDRVAA
jgi:hypothetical protein